MGNKKVSQKKEVSAKERSFRLAEAGKVRLDRLWEACSGVKVGKVGGGA